MRCKENGQAILEFAVILPVFIAVAFGLIDVQFMLERASNLEYIVNETARCQAISSQACTYPNSPTKYATSLATNLRMNDSNLIWNQPPSCSVLVCTASMSYAFKPIGVWFPSIVISRVGTASVGT